MSYGVHRQTDRQTHRQTDRHTDRQTDTQTDRQTHRLTDTQTDRRHAKNEFFVISMPQNMYFHQNLEIDFSDQCNTFSILRIAEKVKSISKLNIEELKNRKV